MLLHIPQVLTQAQVTEMRRALADADWVDGRASVGSQGAQVKRNRQLAEGSPLAQQLGEQVAQAARRHPQFFSAALPLRILPPFFNAYAAAGGEHYGLHVDGAIRYAGAQALRTDVSATLFLSDPDAYDGGELVVVDTYGTHEVKLPAGDLVVYPSTSLHRVEPVTRGERLASFFWVQSLVRDDAQRSMLFELDRNIQSLRAKHGETEEAVALTGLYHNLLRQWSET